jgi:hypothetical protein
MAVFSDSLYAEAGAARIPDNHDVTLHYAKHFGLRLVPFYLDKLNRVYLLRGKRVRVQAGHDVDLSQLPYEFTPEERRVGMSGLMQKYFGAAFRTMRWRFPSLLPTCSPAFSACPDSRTCSGWRSGRPPFQPACTQKLQRVPIIPIVPVPDPRLTKTLPAGTYDVGTIGMRDSKTLLLQSRDANASIMVNSNASGKSQACE